MSDLAGVPVRYSWLKYMDRSAAHARHQALYGSDPTMSMRMGSAIHAATFESHRIRIYRAGTYTDLRGKKPKVREHSDRRTGDAFETFKSAQPPDAIILNEREHAHATAIADAIRRADAERVHPDTGEPLPLLFGTGVVHEQRIAWSVDGRAYSSTPDARLPGRWIADLKMARTGDPVRYPHDATRMGYQAQLVMYDEADAYDRTGDYRAGGCELFSVVVEPKPPYVVTTYRLAASSIAYGRRCLYRWREALAACEAINYWPGYRQAVVELETDDPLASLDSLVDDDDGEQGGGGDDIDWEAA